MLWQHHSNLIMLPIEMWDLPHVAYLYIVLPFSVNI